MKTIWYYLLFFFWFIASLLPLRLLYVFSDMLYFPLYYCIRYRRNVVRKNIATSFPEKNLKEIRKIEKEFYAYFCDYMVETVKLFSISEKNMRKRMKFEGLEQVAEVSAQGRSSSMYLGHYCNWEWVASLPLHLHGMFGAQVYHPLEDESFDKLLLHVRGRFKGVNVKMEETFRVVMGWKKSGQKNIVGYISDQVPGYGSIHYWTNFLNHDTPVFTGAERISAMTDAAVFYGDVYRVKRGYYVCKVVKIADSLKGHPRFYATEQYFRLLESTICRTPQYWLWSHNRWKRTRAEFEQIYSEEERARKLARI